MGSTACGRGAALMYQAAPRKVTVTAETLNTGLTWPICTRTYPGDQSVFVCVWQWRVSSSIGSGQTPLKQRRMAGGGSLVVLAVVLALGYKVLLETPQVCKKHV